MKNGRKIMELFWAFFKIGAFTFGGGYAMIPLIQKEISENKNWITNDDILEIVAIAESTPGPIAINAATFVGFKTAGFWGAFAATFGVVLPSFIIISIISYVLKEFSHLKPVVYAFNGIRAGVLALILKAFWSMFKQCPKNTALYIVAPLSFILAAVFKVNVILVIILSALVGLSYSFMLRRKDV